MTPEDKKIPEQEHTNNNRPQSNENGLPESKGRRNAIKTLATVPVLGAMAYGVYKKQKYDKMMNDVSDVFSLSKETAAIPGLQADGKQIRLGIIGCGIRGKQLLKAAGFASPQYLQDLIDASKKDKKDKKDTRYELFREQEDLNVILTGVCDIFDTFAEEGIAAGANVNREGLGGKSGIAPKRYRHYQEMLAAEDIDAVIIPVRNVGANYRGVRFYKP